MDINGQKFCVWGSNFQPLMSYYTLNLNKNLQVIEVIERQKKNNLSDISDEKEISFGKKRHIKRGKSEKKDKE